MNTALIFSVPDISTIVQHRCHQAIIHLGAPLKSDSGHYITGVVTSGPNNVDLRVTWLEQAAGTQITVSASHEQLSEEELNNVTERFRYEYLNRTSLAQKTGFKLPVSAMFVVASAIAAIVTFVIATLKH